jgi:hypothetical protein
MGARQMGELRIRMEIDERPGAAPESCGACATVILAGDRFCPCCGSPVRHSCPSCGEEVHQAVAIFCPHCGRKLPG